MPITCNTEQNNESQFTNMTHHSFSPYITHHIPAETLHIRKIKCTQTRAGNKITITENQTETGYSLN